MGEIDSARDIAAHHGWLSHMPATFRQSVLDRSVFQKAAAGASIYMTGDPPGGMYGLISGGLSVTIASGDRGPYVAHFLGPGTWFGEGPAISGHPRLVGLKATRKTKLLHLPLRAIEAILEDDPSTWRCFATLVLEKLDIAIAAVNDLMIRDSTARFVAVLLRLGGCRNTTPSGGSSIEFDASQEDLAAMANVSRTTAHSILRKLVAARYVRLSYRRVQLISPDALRVMLSRLD